MNEGESGRRVGEVVEASTTAFATQCYELYEAPALGSLMRCGGENPIYGVVFDVATKSMDPARHPIARGQDEDTLEDVYRNNPQLSRLLLTEFQSVIVGHRLDGYLLRHLAPLPPRIHSFVYRCEAPELREFTGSLEFIPLLLSAPVGAPDEVLASLLIQAGRSHEEPDLFLTRAGKELAAHLVGQLPRLNLFLKRIAP